MSYSKKVATCLVIIYILLLFPVLYIGRYNYHCADDFGFSAASHIAWENTNSIIAVFQAAGETVVDRWYTWQGTFTTIFMMAIEPGIFGDTYYHFVPWLMIGTMTVSTMFLLYMLLVDVIGCDKSTWIIMSTLYLIYVFECMVDPLQGFFWYNGAVHYMIPHSIALMLIGVLIRAAKRNKYIILGAIACVFAFLLGGSNYISALGTGIGLLYAIVINLLLKNKAKIGLYIVPFIFYIPALLLNVLAPGNSVRQASFSDHPGVVKAILLAFYYCIDKTLSAWCDWRLLGFLIILFPVSVVVVKRIKSNYSFEFKYPAIVVLLSFCFISALFAPTSYALGETGGGRVENIIFLDYILAIIFNEIYLVGWLDQRYHLTEEIAINSAKKKKKQLFYCSIVIAIIFCTCLTSLRDENCYTTSSAVFSLITGEGKRYGEETEVRTKAIEQCEGDLLEVPRFVETPYLLYMDDIVPDVDDWRNNSMEKYYGIKEVRAYSVE